MKRTAAACILAALCAACAPGAPTMIEIDGRAAPSNDCKFKAGGDFLMGPGLLDVGASPQPTYRLVVYVKNNLADPTVQSPTSIVSSKVWYAQEARVRVNPKDYIGTYAPSPSLLAIQTENRLPLDGQGVQPAGGTSTQFVDAVSGPVGSQLAMQVAPGETRRVVLGITLLGKTGDGASADTGEWFFALDVCNGCLAAPTSCPSGQVLQATSCFGVDQDSAPVCALPK